MSVNPPGGHRIIPLALFEAGHPLPPETTRPLSDLEGELLEIRPLEADDGPAIIEIAFSPLRVCASLDPLGRPAVDGRELPRLELLPREQLASGREVPKLHLRVEELRGRLRVQFAQSPERVGPALPGAKSETLTWTQGRARYRVDVFVAEVSNPGQEQPASLVLWPWRSDGIEADSEREPSDAELLAEAATNPVAGARLLRRHQALVERYIRPKVNRQEIADDLIQDTLCVMLELAGKPRKRETITNLPAFIIGVANNKLYEHYRKTKSTIKGQASFQQYSVAQLEGEGPFDILAKSRDGQILAHALRQIPIEQQTLLLLFYWEGLTRPEIGELLGLEVGTVGSRLHAARKILHRHLRRITSGLVDLHETSRALEKWQLKVREAGLCPALNSNDDDDDEND